MSIPEATQLVLQAAGIGEGGEIMVLNMGEPIKIVDLAHDFIRLSGYEPEEDIKIEYVGLRPGEKLYEELLLNDENMLPTSHHLVSVAKARSADEKLTDWVNQILSLAEKDECIRDILGKIVPEYSPSKLNN